MAKAPKELKKVKFGEREQSQILEECQKHERDSYNYLASKRDTWPDKEAMLICKLEDDISGGQKSQVFDPVLSTMLLERTARTMYQNPSGKAYAVSRDDVGKNKIMNLLLKFFRKNANEQFSHLMKLRMLDFFSGVFGSYFALIPWRVNPYLNYIGPELLLIDIYKCRPQPHRGSVNQSDWFTVQDDISLAWLIKQAKQSDQWINMDRIAAQMKVKKDEGDTRDSSSETSLVEQEWYPSIYGDVKYPTLKTFTEYRRDLWITWCQQKIDEKTQKAWIIRLVENPYPDGMLPIVAKHAFPMMNSIIGLGEFERGETLQKALNSLWNLYLDGVKYSIFPPLHINPDEVAPSSVKWGAGEKWFMNHPNVDVQTMNISPRGLETFQSTYGYMISAIQNLSGSTTVTQPQGQELSLGKTPQAIQFRSMMQSARDEWDRFMIEDTINEVYNRWIALITNNMTEPQVLRIYEEEIKDVKAAYPEENMIEVFKSGKRGNLTVDNSVFYDKKSKDNRPVSFDYELETGSTMKKNIEDEAQTISAIIQSLSVKVGQTTILEEIRAKGGDVDVKELYKRWVALSLKDYNKIIIEPENMAGEEVTPQGVNPEEIPVPTGQQQVTPVAAQPETPRPEFTDPEIAAAAEQVLGGMAGIPAA